MTLRAIILYLLTAASVIASPNLPSSSSHSPPPPSATEILVKRIYTSYQNTTVTPSSRIATFVFLGILGFVITVTAAILIFKWTRRPKAAWGDAPRSTLKAWPAGEIWAGEGDKTWGIQTHKTAVDGGEMQKPEPAEKKVGVEMGIPVESRRQSQWG